MKNIILAFLLLLSSTAHAGSLQFLNKDAIYPNPLASPRSTELSVQVVTSKYQKERVAYLDIALGRAIGLVGYSTLEWAVQLGAEAGAWITLGYTGDLVFPLLTEDFLLSAPLSFHYKSWDFSLKYTHISAHLGDGMTALLEEGLSKREQKTFEFYEELAQDADMDLTLVEPQSYSREILSAHVSHEHYVLNYQVRTYLHASYMYKVVPDTLERWAIGGGTEIKWWKMFYSPYTAVDVTWNQDTHSVDVSTQAGFWIKPYFDKLTVRVAVTYFEGMDRRGQLLGTPLKRWGVGLFIR